MAASARIRRLSQGPAVQGRIRPRSASTVRAVAERPRRHSMGAGSDGASTARSTEAASPARRQGSPEPQYVAAFMVCVADTVQSVFYARLTSVLMAGMRQCGRGL